MQIEVEILVSGQTALRGPERLPSPLLETRQIAVPDRDRVWTVQGVESRRKLKRRAESLEFGAY
jgi:hypothetical protein